MKVVTILSPSLHHLRFEPLSAKASSTINALWIFGGIRKYHKGTDCCLILFFRAVAIKNKSYSMFI